MLLIFGVGSVVWCQPTTGECREGQVCNVGAVDEWLLQQQQVKVDNIDNNLLELMENTHTTHSLQNQTVTQIQCDLKSMAEQQQLQTSLLKQQLDERLENLSQILTSFINQSMSRQSALELQHREMQAVMENVSKTQQQVVDSVLAIQNQTAEKRGGTCPDVICRYLDLSRRQSVSRLIGL